MGFSCQESHVKLSIYTTKHQITYNLHVTRLSAVLECRGPPRRRLCLVVIELGALGAVALRHVERLLRLVEPEEEALEPRVVEQSPHAGVPFVTAR